ncbi:Alpha-monoglucosyldiacylglycerol synthase [Marinobacter litoralis]|uniref:Alpha-monoglucosyldiacylglycerol synthase n=1 Tax=Marinobacter litoralis TaxID=187981 RepID=A0A3M2RLQ3_9GAMM|nr:glycosyltransferase [Marinobacter litoralis]RMJ06129.1 Alpha-monoglucosyldiacylglycerol synthase [Marinobacter litoralis]
MMRVFHVTASGGLFGAEKALIDLAATQARIGLDVTIVSLNTGDGSDTVEKEFSRNNLKYLSIPFEEKVSRRQVSGLKALFEKGRPDIIHAHNYKANIYSVLCKPKGNTCRLVSTAHGYLLPPIFSALRIYYFLDRKFLRKYDHIVCVSDRTKQSLKTSLKGSVPISVIRNGISSFSDAGELNIENSDVRFEENRFNLICVGRLSPEKNFSEAIKIFSHILEAAPNSLLWVVGNGPELGALRQLSDRLGLGEKVTFLGYRTDAEVLIRCADMLMISSKSEGLPITLLEAMKNSTIVAYRDVGDIDYVLNGGEFGCRLDGPPEKCAKDIVDLLQNDEKRKLMVHGAGRRLIAKFSAENMEKLYREVYQMVMQ